MKLALDSIFLNEQKVKNKYQMPKIQKPANNAASHFSEKSDQEVWFTKLDLKYANSQLNINNFTSKHSNCSIVGGNITGTN